MAGLVDAHSDLRKCSWSHLDPKSFKTNALSILFEGFLGGCRKAIFRLETPKPSAGATEPSEEAVEPSEEAVERSADTAEPRSKTAEPRPAHGDSTFSSEPGAPPPRTFYGDSAVLSEPGAKATEPSTETTKPSADSLKPNRDSPARDGAQERSWRCAGLRGFGAKSS